MVSSSPVLEVSKRISVLTRSTTSSSGAGFTEVTTTFPTIVGGDAPGCDDRFGLCAGFPLAYDGNHGP
ncbi:Uncharacterised protein [Mycobacteroides abscessus subsp. abscessus]|nr:Uncharacterised protein [Mycobacteroides abscessus subsp. abscessus]